MNVLVLHGFRDLRLARNTTRNHLMCYQRYVPEHNYLYSSAYESATPALKAIDWSLVIFDTSFLSQRTVRPRADFIELQDRWGWLSDSEAVKVALPQDEYDACLILDDWLADLRVDTVYSAVGHRDVLYPRSLRSCEFVDCLTGYIDDDDVAAYKRHWKPLRERCIDLGYRARDLSPHIGRLGRLKADVHHRFLKQLGKSGLRLNSEIAVDAALLGDDWRKFLCECRFAPASPSGSSLYDPRGEISDRVAAFRQLRPEATFDEVEAECFPGLDGLYEFAAVSPRVFEAAAAGACQILVGGSQLADLVPNVHFIPIQRDFSDLDLLEDRLRDLNAAQAIAEACQEMLLESDAYRYRTFASDVLSRAQRKAEARGISNVKANDFKAKVRDHKRQRTRMQRQARVARCFEHGLMKGAILWTADTPPVAALRTSLPVSLRSALRRLLLP